MNTPQITKAVFALFVLVAIMVVTDSFIRTGGFSAQSASVISGTVTGPTSRDPQKDIIEVSRAFAALHGVEACSLAKSMNAVFGVECSFQQNCGGGDSYIGSFQQGVGYVQGAERKLGADLARMEPLVRAGKINQGVYTHMLAAAQQGRALGPSRARMHHMYATMLALVEHVRMERALQARTQNQLERAAAHVIFQFSPGNVGAAINSGRDRNSPWGGQNGIPNGYTVFQALRLAASGQYKGAAVIRQGIQNINCSTTAGYDTSSGFGDINAVTTQGNNNPVTNAFQQSPLGQFLGLSNQQTYQEGYLDPNKNPLLRPENDPSQRALNGNSNNTSGSNTTNSQNSISSLLQQLRGESATSSSTTGSDGTTSDGVGTGTGNTADETLPPRTLHNTTPTLLCLPSPVGSGETALIMWACRDGAYKTEGTNLDTNNTTIGSTKVTPTDTTTYTVECINNIDTVDNTAASCEIHVANPALALIATPSTATRNQTVTLSWKTKDTSSCTLTADDYPSFSRSGVAGDVVSPTLVRNTTFSLECDTITGETIIKEITVGVN